MECEKCGCKSNEAIFVEMPLSVGWRTYCVPCLVEYQYDIAMQLCVYLDEKIGTKELKEERAQL